MSVSLQFTQRKSLEARSRNDEEGRAERIGEPFGPGELGFRLVYMRDAGFDARQAWLAGLIEGCDEGFRYSEFDSFIFSARQSEFDVAILHGLDWRRLSGAVTHNRALLFNRIAIALLNESTPSRRASLLMAGYDDVFDLRMALPEARARLRRHVLRKSATRNKAALELLGLDVWPRSVSMSLSPAIIRAAARFTPRERILFGSLFGSIGRTVQYSALLRSYEVRELKDGYKSLRVAMSGLRRKLDGLFKIHAHHHQGYELRLVDGLGALEDSVPAALIGLDLADEHDRQYCNIAVPVRPAMSEDHKAAAFDCAE